MLHIKRKIIILFMSVMSIYSQSFGVIQAYNTPVTVSPLWEINQKFYC